MATKTFEELKQMAIQIRDEKANKQNTATRIGTQMVEHLNKLEQEYYNKENIDEQKEQTDAKFSELDKLSSALLSEASFSLRNVQISNLFDKDSPTQFTEKHSGNGDNAYYYSDFMPVMGLDKIYSNLGRGYWYFYDKDGNTLNTPTGGASEMEVPEGAISLRILCIATGIENAKRNGVVVPYPNYNSGQPYGAVILSDEIREFGARQTQAQSRELYSTFSHLGIRNNLLANVKRFADYELNPSGIVRKNTGTAYPVSDFISVEPSTQYQFYSAGHIGWYDENKEVISAQVSVNTAVVTSPANAAYLRVCGGWGVFENSDYFKKHKTNLISQYMTKGQRPVFIPAYGGMFIEGDTLNLRGFFFYLGAYYDMRRSLDGDEFTSVNNERAKVDLAKATEHSGHIAYLLFDPTKIYNKGYVFLCNYNEISNYPEAVIWKGVVYDSSNRRYYIDEFDGSLALSRFEGRNEAGSQTSEIINDWSYENLIDYTQFVDSTLPYTGEGTSDYYQVIDNIPCQENTWYWGWSTGYVQVLNNQEKSIGIYMIQNHGTNGLAFKTPKGAYTMAIYAAPTDSINQVRLVIGKSKVDVSPYGIKKYKDPYLTNPYWFDLVNDKFWVNQVSADGFTNKLNGTNYNYQIWTPIVGKTYTGNSKGYQAECYDINNKLLHRFAEADKTFTIPEGTAYCRTYTRVGTESTVMIIPGTTLPTTYVPYGERISKADTTDYYLNGRKYCGLGDSITDGDGNGSVSWYDYLLQRLHADSSSLNFAETGQCLRTMADRCTAENMQNVSKVFIMGGTNQMGHFSIGTIDDKPTPDLIEANRTYTVGERVLGGPKEKHGWTTPIYAYTIIYECTIEGNTGEVSDDFITTMPTTAEQTIQVGTATFKVIGYPTWYADMWRIVDRVWGFNNKCEIIWLVPIKTTRDVGKPASQWAKKDKFQAVRDFCEYNSIRYIDLQKEFPLNSYTKDSIMADSLHPNKTGYEIICDIVMSHL